jgi:hypothetical protein
MQRWRSILNWDVSSIGHYLILGSSIIKSMKTKAYTTILTVSALIAFGALGALAQTEHQQKDMSKMDMSGMMNEPHHALAMTYMQTIGSFAKTLQDQAEGACPLNVKVAREAVDEMKRSLDRMEEHHAEHVKTMNDEMRSHMAAMMKEMEAHRTMLKDAVSALEKDVKVDRPDSRKIATDSANVLKHLDDMSKMDK